MKKNLGITGVWSNKPKTFEQYIEYRNELIMKRDNRRKHFGPATNYYDLRLIEIDAQHPEFKNFGKVVLK